jgi:cytochrome c nitrite reductase small subunit
MDFKSTLEGEGHACWDCHRDVPHGENGLSSTPAAIVPYPESPAPEWLKEMIK